MAKTKRSDELGRKKAIKEAFLKVLNHIDLGITDQQERADQIRDAWDVYDCIYNDKMFYNGNSQVYISLVADAVDARVTRFSNQLFPQSQRYVEVTSENPDLPQAVAALLEHYVRRTKLQTEIVPALLTAGDVEGQYTLYAGWEKTKRTLVYKVQKPVKVDDFEHDELGTVDDVEEEEIEEGCPTAEIILDSDLIILPATALSVDDAIEQGGSVTVIRRWGKAKIRKLIAEGEILKDAGEAMIEAMDKAREGDRPDTGKRLASHAGIKAKGDFSLVYEVWTKLEVDGEYRLCRGYGGGEDRILGVKLNPYWCDKCPVISAPVNKRAKGVKGIAPIRKVLDLQYLANDYLNEAADTGHFSAMPIIMTDPEKNPRVSSMVLGLASIWETSPNDTKFAQFPELWKDGLSRVMAIQQQIFGSLSVNPSMIAQSTGKPGAKRNQAEIANEQMVDILTTASAVTTVEGGVLTPLLQRWAEYDHQFRDDAITVRMYGTMGMRAVMQDVEPLQINRRFEFRWFGVESARNAAQVQQQIGMLNVLKEVPPQMYQGYRLDMGPIMAQLVENTFGPRLAPLIFVSMQDDLGVDPELENQMLEHGFDTPVHPADNDPEHMQVHMQAMQQGDPHGVIRVHLQKHQMQMQMKAQAAQAQQQGAPPGGGGGPQPGAAPGAPHAAKQPPGAIHQDRMPAAGAAGMPRKM